MTEAPARWWAPPAPSTSLTAVEKALFEHEGANPQLDLGGVFLGAHRAGAAACYHAARQPMLAERDLIHALATVRAELGEAMLEGVAKCVHSSSVAALLTRDFLDDADAAALGLFRTAVAKGVPPAAAARRAGDVYGVDARAMGRYRQLAIDPKTQPAMLVDAADRTLFEYVEKVAAEELADELVEVEKATLTAERQVISDHMPNRNRNRSTWVYVRDERGRFSEVMSRARQRAVDRKKAAAEPALPTVQTEPGEPVANRKTLEDLRARRAKRRAAIQRAAAAAPDRSPKPVQSDVEAQPRQRQATERAVGQRQVGTRKLNDRQLNDRLMANRKLIEEYKKVVPQAVPSKELVVPDVPPAKGIGNELTQRFKQTGYQFRPDLEHETVIAMEGSEALGFRALIGEQAGKIFRVGHLMDAPNTSAPVQLKPTSHMLNHAEGIDALEKAARGSKHDLDGYDFLHVPQEDLEQRDGFAMSMLDRIRRWKDLADDDPTPAHDVYPAADGDGWVVVDLSNKRIEEMPTVYEFHVPAGELGMTTGGGGAGETIYDKNALFRVKVGPLTQTQFDHAGGFAVRRYTLERVSEADLARAQAEHSVDKALTVTERSIAVQDQPRDELGRWSDRMAAARTRAQSRTAPVNVAPTKLKALRGRREKQRAARRTRVVPVPVQATERLQAAAPVQTRQTAERALTPRQARSRDTVQRVLAEATADLGAPPKKTPRREKIDFMWDTMADYAAMNMRSFKDLTGKAMPDSVIVPAERLPELFERRTGFQDAHAYVHRAHMDSKGRLVNLGDGGLVEQGSESFLINLSEDDPDAISRTIRNKIGELNVTQVRAQRIPAVGDEEAHDTWRISFDTSGNEPQYIVQISDEAQFGDGDIELVRRAGYHVLRSQRDYGANGIVASAIPVVVYDAILRIPGAPSRPRPEDD